MKKRNVLFILLSICISLAIIYPIYYSLAILPHQVDFVDFSIMKIRLNMNACHFLIVLSFIVVLFAHLWMYKMLQNGGRRVHIFWTPAAIYFLCWTYVQLIFFIDWLKINTLHLTSALTACESYLLLLASLFTTLQIACYWFTSKPKNAVSATPMD